MRWISHPKQHSAFLFYCPSLAYYSNQQPDPGKGDLNTQEYKDALKNYFSVVHLTALQLWGHAFDMATTGYYFSFSLKYLGHYKFWNDTFGHSESF